MYMCENFKDFFRHLLLFIFNLTELWLRNSICNNYGQVHDQFLQMFLGYKNKCILSF